MFPDKTEVKLGSWLRLRCTFGRGMSHIWLCCRFGRGMSHIWLRCTFGIQIGTTLLLHIWLRCVTGVTEACHTNVWVMSHIWLRHERERDKEIEWNRERKRVIVCWTRCSRMILSWRTYDRVWCHTYDCVMSRVYLSHMTYIYIYIYIYIDTSIDVYIYIYIYIHMYVHDHVTHMTEGDVAHLTTSCHAHTWDMWHTYNWVMLHIELSHVAHLTVSCHACTRAMWRI